jgi:hypothetical protein
MLAAVPLEAAASSPAIGMDDAALGYCRWNRSFEAAGCNVGDRRHPNPPDPDPYSDHRNSLRLGLPSDDSPFNLNHIRFVNFKLICQQVTAWLLEPTSTLSPS